MNTDATSQLSDGEIDRLLSTPIPGGSAARDWFLPHDTEQGLANVRTVVRLMLAAAPPLITLTEFYRANRALLNTLGREDASAEDERKAEERFDKASAAVRLLGL